MSMSDPVDSRPQILKMFADEVAMGALPKKVQQGHSLQASKTLQDDDSLRSNDEDQDEDKDPLPTEDEDDEGVDQSSHQFRHAKEDWDTGHDHKVEWAKWTKIIILLLVWCLFTIFLMTKNEKVVERTLVSVPPALEPKDFIMRNIPKGLRFGVTLDGAFATEGTANNLTTKYLYVYAQLLYLGKEKESTAVLQEELWKITLVDEALFDSVPDVRTSKIFTIKSTPNDTAALRIRMMTDASHEVPLLFIYNDTPVDKDMGVVYAAIVLCGLYIMIIWEVVNRTLAAIITSIMAIGILAAMDERPTMATIMTWLDVETLSLLFGMMILVAMLSETGIFDYLAVFAYKITNGKVWPLISSLCLLTAVISSFIDNVTAVMLMTPITIRLCEVMVLNPVPVLMCMIIYSNIGGSLTPVGGPQNVIIASNSFIAKNGVTFVVFTVHMLIGLLVVMVQTYIQLRFMFRDINDLRFHEALNIQELRHELSVWQKTAASLSSYSLNEDHVRMALEKKINRLQSTLKQKMSTESFIHKQNVRQLEAKYPILNKPLLYKLVIALVFVIGLFFLHSIPQIHTLSLGWAALLGAILLLILADREDMETVLARVEWSTLLFFGALFVLMEALSELGLIDWIGSMTVNVIMSVGEESRLAVAVLFILWVSAIASAFVDNIPLTTMMIKIVISLAKNKDLGLPLQPLAWALAFGAGLGGNGTLIGSSANVVCAGVAEEHGYKFTFLEFFKIGFPVMIGSMIVATVYLMVAHVLFAWH